MSLRFRTHLIANINLQNNKKNHWWVTYIKKWVMVSICSKNGKCSHNLFLLQIFLWPIFFSYFKPWCISKNLVGIFQLRAKFQTAIHIQKKTSKPPKHAFYVVLKINVSRKHFLNWTSCSDLMKARKLKH